MSSIEGGQRPREGGGVELLPVQPGKHSNWLKETHLEHESPEPAMWFSLATLLIML